MIVKEGGAAILVIATLMALSDVLQWDFTNPLTWWNARIAILLDLLGEALRLALGLVLLYLTAAPISKWIGSVLVALIQWGHP